MKATINDIAKMAGVSKATVSRVLNGSKPVSDKIRFKVMKVVQETNYKPSSLARSLVSKKTHIFGIVIPDVSNPSISRLVKGIQQEANNNGYDILLCNTCDNEEKEIEYLQILDEKEVDGIVFITSRIQESHKKFFENYKKPVVSVDRKFFGLDISSINVDNYSATYNAVNYLLNLNHKRIAMIRGSLDNRSCGYDRYEGYKQALLDSNITVDEALVVEAKFKVEDGYNAMSKLLAQKKLPTAVFCSCDEMAVGAIKCAYESEFKVPDHISIIGFDDVPIASMFIPSITTIRQPVALISKKSVELLLNHLDGKVEIQNVVLATELIVRQSTKRNS